MLKQLTSPPINEAAPKVFGCQKNGAARLPYFLDYYRNLGVGTFFLVDNNSDDGSVEFLREQDDVVLYWTDESYQEANAGRRWTDELMQRHAGESWCLTLDNDEFLLYPFSEQVKLPEMIHYLEQRGFQGLFTIMLDFYPEGPLVEAQYGPGDSVFEVSSCHDHVEGYNAHSETYFPYFTVRGGMRQRLFFSVEEKKSGPPQKKIPLIKHHEGFSFQYSTHGTTPLRLADITGALAHFKFFGDAPDYIKAEVKGKDRKNPRDYRIYQRGLEKTKSFFCDIASRMHVDSVELTNEGFLAISERYYEYLERHALEQGGGLVDKLGSIKTDFHVPLNQLMQAWPLLSALQPKHADVQKELEEYADAKDYVVAMRKHYSLAMTLPLRKWLRKWRLISAKLLPEYMDRDYTLKEQIRFTYDSTVWDLSAPIRLIGRVYDYLWIRFRR